MIYLEDIVRSTGAQLIQKGTCERLSVVATDSRTAKKGSVFFALQGPRFDGHDFIHQAIARGARAVVISKNIPQIKNNPSISFIKVKDTTIALGDLARFNRSTFNIPFIAVTGSSGKTTTKEIIARVLSQKYHVLKSAGTHNNNIGLPLTLFRLEQNHSLCIAELGTNHFGEITYLSKILQPNVGVITNIGSSHLAFLKNEKGVLREKKSLIRFLTRPKIVFLNRDDAHLRAVKVPNSVNVFYFSIHESSDLRASDISLSHNRTYFTLNKKHSFSLNTVGRFNVYNAIAAIGCGLIFGISIKKIRGALEDFVFPDQRLQHIECAHFNILDDTYNSNPFSLQQAIRSLSEYKTPGRRIVVMGDMLELGEHSLALHKKMGMFIAQQPIDVLVTFGEFSKVCAQAVRQHVKGDCTIVTCDSKDDVIAFLKRHIRTGDTLLIKGSRLLKMEDITTSLENHAL